MIRSRVVLLFQSSLIISFTVLVDWLRTSNGLSMGEFDNVKLYHIFDLIHMHFYIVFHLFMSCYAGIAILFQEHSNAELTCGKKTRNDEETKKIGRMEEKSRKCSF